MSFLNFFFDRNHKSKAQKLNEEDSWIYELVYEHMTSPIWKIAISEYIDENCIFFDDDDNNQNEQLQIHQQFLELISSQFDQMIIEFSITEEQLKIIILQGLQHPKHKPIFQQIIAVNDFILFKKTMIKRNKELELEAFQEMEKQDQLKYQQQHQQQQNNQFDQQQFEVKRLQIEKEKADLELAIEISKKTEEEQKRQHQENDEQLQKILEQSLQEYNKNIQKLSVIIEQEEQLKSQPEYKKSEMLRSIKNVKYPSFTSFVQRQQELGLEKKISEEVQKHPGDQDLSYIPPIIQKVTSELLEEVQESHLLTEQKQKFIQCKEDAIKKRNDILKSELLQFQQVKQQQNKFQTQYQYE